jgi:hypothetical protein
MKLVCHASFSPYTVFFYEPKVPNLAKCPKEYEGGNPADISISSCDEVHLDEST